MEEIVKCTQSSPDTMQNLITFGITIAGALIGALVGGLFSYKIALSSIDRQFKNQKKWDNEKREIEIEEKKKFIENSIYMFLLPELISNKEKLNRINFYNNFDDALEAYVTKGMEVTCNRLVFTKYEDLKSNLFEFLGNDIYGKIISVYSTMQLIEDYTAYDTLSIIKFNRMDTDTYDKLKGLNSAIDNLICLLKERNK